jgi:hypothetical protein
VRCNIPVKYIVIGVMKFVFSFLLSLLFVPGKGQKIDSAMGIPQETSGLKIRIVCAPSAITGYPLVIIDGRRFDGSYLQHLFFNINDIESLRVIGSKQDSIKYFGKAGKYGVIILQMKNPVKWISSKTIASQKLGIFKSHREILFEVDGKEFEPGEKVYFAKGFIKNISVSNTSSYSADKLYQKKIIVTTTNPSGNR